MKIRPISEAEIAKMMRDGLTLYRKPGMKFPKAELRKGLIRDMTMQALTPYDIQRRLWSIIITKDALPVLKLIDDTQGNYVAVLRVNTDGEESWYKVFDAIQDAFDNCFSYSFRSPDAYVVLDEPHPITGQFPKVVYSMDEEKQRAIGGHELTPDEVYKRAEVMKKWVHEEYMREMAMNEETKE